jgi:hypothetical protein
MGIPVLTDGSGCTELDNIFILQAPDYKSNTAGVCGMQKDNASSSIIVLVNMRFGGRELNHEQGEGGTRPHL